MSRPLVIDTFPINGELEMLQMRLEEMSPAVDYFIAVEADVDHQDHPKPYHISDNIDRFAAWADKLIVVKATGLPTHADDPDPWARELAQREYVKDGLTELHERGIDLGPDTVILHGDVDEICRPLFVRNCHPAGVEFVSFGQRMFCFAVDWQHPDMWCGTVAATLRQIVQIGAKPFQKLRNTRNRNHIVLLGDSGWHFSWLGGKQVTLNKLNSFCHPEIAERTLVGLNSELYLREGLHVDGRRQIPVEVDDTWPRMIVERRCPETWFRPR